MEIYVGSEVVRRETFGPRGGKINGSSTFQMVILSRAKVTLNRKHMMILPDCEGVADQIFIQRNSAESVCEKLKSVNIGRAVSQDHDPRHSVQRVQSLHLTSG